MLRDDGEAEVVTISAVSRFGLRVVSGKVIFGKAGTTGVGTLMLRESRNSRVCTVSWSRCRNGSNTRACA